MHSFTGKGVKGKFNYHRAATVWVCVCVCVCVCLWVCVSFWLKVPILPWRVYKWRFQFVKKCLRRRERTSNKQRSQTRRLARQTARKKGRKGKRRYNRVIFSGSANARVGTRETFFVSACFFSLPGEENIRSTEETITRAFSPTVFYWTLAGRD